MPDMYNCCAAMSNRVCRRLWGESILHTQNIRNNMMHNRPACLKSKGRGGSVTTHIKNKVSGIYNTCAFQCALDLESEHNVIEELRCY